MRAGWLRFGRKLAATPTPSPDSAVAAPPAWLLGAVIVASTAALLGTTEAPVPNETGVSGPVTTYTFERQGIDGGGVELTRDQPTATFFVIVHVDDLGPDGANTTDQASATVDGTLTVSGLDDGVTAPLVNVKLSSPDDTNGAGELARDVFDRERELVFSGDCANPKASQDCTARFAVELTRLDQGENGGVVRFDWLFDVQAQAQAPAAKAGNAGPFDPPWSIEVSQP